MSLIPASNKPIKVPNFTDVTVNVNANFTGVVDTGDAPVKPLPVHKCV
jgi:hypothetical protein